MDELFIHGSLELLYNRLVEMYVEHGMPFEEFHKHIMVMAKLSETLELFDDIDELTMEILGPDSDFEPWREYYGPQ